MGVEEKGNEGMGEHFCSLEIRLKGKISDFKFINILSCLSFCLPVSFSMYIFLVLILLKDLNIS